MAAWRVELTALAERDLERLDETIARRVVAKLEEATSNPARFFLRLVGSNLHKLRVGDYRILGLLSTATKTLIVQRIEHGSRVYDRRRSV